MNLLTCLHCNGEILQSDLFCPHCGRRIVHTKKSKDSAQKSIVNNQFGSFSEHSFSALEKRNYFRWFLISVLTLGIGGIVYLYFSITDLEKLPVEIEDPINDIRSRGSSIICEICCWGVLIAFIQIYYNYKKIKLFREYLIKQPEKPKRVLLNDKLMLWSKILRFLTISSGIPILVGFYQTWQSLTWNIVGFSLLGIFLITSITIHSQLALWQKYFNNLIEEKKKSMNFYP